ncbi:MAG: aminoacyl-tRNA hydrolase [Magnetococcales bacterium]|nr:aminoacyl-tRNA hydrolase [Magnetococcales bacterium]
MRLLVGLGNPGDRYRATRHNLGRDAVLRIASHFGLEEEGGRFRGRFGSGRVGARRILWLLPETFMNLSGGPVADAVRFHKLEPDQVIVFHDDLDLALGRVRIKRGGGNGGHNGLRSIQQTLGTGEFVRVRLGVGRPPERMEAADFVLSRFSPPEREQVERLLDDLPRGVPDLLEGNLAGAMNRLCNAPAAKAPALPE